MISNCGKDENGKYSGGRAGDQTGREYCVQAWYSRPWKCVLRHPNEKVQEKLAQICEKAARNDNIGYDQGQRLTYYDALRAANWDPAAITKPCEADCSSSTMANIIATGHTLAIPTLQNVNKAAVTSNMRKALTAAGFDLLTSSKYLTSDKYLLPGDVLLYDGHHVAVNLTKGSAVVKSSTQNVNITPEASGKATKALCSKLQSANKRDVAIAGKYKTTTALNLRYGPGSNAYAVITTMPAGTLCRNYGYYSLDAKGGKWLLVVVTVNGKQYTGFASAAYLKK